MSSNETPSAAELVDRARALVPVLRERARKTEELRTLPDETFDEIREAGFLRFFQPARYGGYEMDWGVQVDLGRQLGRACGSTAWIVSVVCTHAVMVGRMSRQAQDDVWAEEPDVLIATGSARTEGEAEPVDGGYLLSGTWRFASGVDHATWAMVAAPLETEEWPTEGPPNLIQCLVPAGDFQIDDDWYVSGLRGTGSKKVVIPDKVFVPDYRTIGFRELLSVNPPGGSVNDGYIYRMEFGPYFGTSLFGPILGTAEGALEDYLSITRDRIGAIFRNRVGEAQSVQLRVARSAAEINAAAMLATDMVDRFHRLGAADEVLAPQQRVESMRDRAYLTTLAVDAVHRLVRQMGATGLSDDNPVQRHFRDLSAAAGQIGLNWDRNVGAYGKWILGFPTGDPAIDEGEPSPASVE